jgi:hypothetical protein
MTNQIEKKERYMSDPLSIRLGGLAANLARVKSFSKNAANEKAVFDLFEESKNFIEWTAQDAEIGTTVELIELQLQIAVWQHQWQKTWEDKDNRELLARTSADWSRKLLERSGLLSR